MHGYETVVSARLYAERAYKHSQVYHWCIHVQYTILYVQTPFLKPAHVA